VTDPSTREWEILRVDYIGAGFSPLDMSEINALIKLETKIRLVPLVNLPFALKKWNTKVYDHRKIDKVFSELILPGSKDLISIKIVEHLKAFLTKPFLEYSNYPRNPITRSKMIATAEKLNRIYVKVGKPNLLHLRMFSEVALFNLFLSKMAKIPYTITLHATDFMMRSRRRTRYLRKICENAAAIRTISNYNRGYLAGIGVDTEKIHVIRAGVDVEKFKRKLGYEANNTILYVGRFIRCKGLEYLLEAVNILKKDFREDFKVKLIGDGPLEAELKDRAHALKIDKIVKFEGVLEETSLISNYETASVFVHPSVELPDGRKDGIPVSIMEAMAMELPVVSTYCSGIPEIVDDNWNGILVSQRNPAKLAEALRFLLENPTVAKEFGRRGREKVVREYNIDLNAKKLYQIWCEIVDKGQYDIT